jgi:hypothetical protein
MCDLTSKRRGLRFGDATIDITLMLGKHLLEGFLTPRLRRVARVAPCAAIKLATYNATDVFAVRSSVHEHSDFTIGRVVNIRPSQMANRCTERAYKFILCRQPILTHSADKQVFLDVLKLSVLHGPLS